MASDSGTRESRATREKGSLSGGPSLHAAFCRGDASPGFMTLEPAVVDASLVVFPGRIFFATFTGSMFVTSRSHQACLTQLLIDLISS